LKKQYQIEEQRAVQQFRRIASEQNPNIAVMEQAARHLAGERHEQHAGRHAHRWGKEDGYCVVDGQKVPIPDDVFTHGCESKRGAQPGRRDGRNVDRSQPARSRSATPNSVAAATSSAGGWAIRSGQLVAERHFRRVFAPGVMPFVISPVISIRVPCLSGTHST